jgi:hypothetical protein
MMEAIREEIEKIEKSAEKVKALGQDNPAVRRNAEIILTFVYILKLITKEVEEPIHAPSRI